MKITIVQGFFLPMPPAAGGAMEKAWWALAREFARLGHEVTSISRCWPCWPDREYIDGIRCIRLPGFAHTTSLPRNLVLDALWGKRILRHLPLADILATNTVLLPALAPWLRPSSGKVVVNLNRMPKGQLFAYRRVARIQVPSTAVANVVNAQCPRLTPVTRIFPNPIDLSIFPLFDSHEKIGPIRIGYIGRLHPEKGIDLLIEAARVLLGDSSLPDWTLELRGPSDVPRGGGGDAYLARLHQQAAPLLTAHRFAVHAPEFNPVALARHYAALDLFAYPSLAENGETFGVSVAEAMAAGAVPVVSDLACFTDLVTHNSNGLVFTRKSPDAVAQLATALACLIRDPSRRAHLRAAARERITSLDIRPIAQAMLADFEILTQGA